MRPRIFLRGLVAKLGLTTAPTACGFCLGTDGPLAAAPRVAICASCIAGARAVLALQPAPEHLALLPAPEAACTFCLEPPVPGARTVRGRSANICAPCIVLAEDMLREAGHG